MCLAAQRQMLNPASKLFRPLIRGHSTMATVKQALLCIDMQNDFCLPTSSLCVKGALGCLPKVQEAVQVAREHGIPVVWVVREHHQSGKLVKVVIRFGA